MIHSSSATIGIVMGLGAAGVLDWTTAVAFSLGADLGTTITSWMASLNLSKNAKRAAYAHISFNIIGVCITIPLFFVSIEVLRMGHAVVRRRSRHPGDGRRQGDLPAGAGRGRPLLDLLQRLQHAAAVSFRRRVRAGAVAHRPHGCRGRRGLFDAEIPRPQAAPATSPRPSRPCSRRRIVTSRPARCSSTSPAAQEARRPIRASTISRPTSSAATSAPTRPR